ncbi:MAG TPA: ABC transporter ATP-binding protein [Spirochaetales bacterium]|nr:ABC transporter ATP-binding protein [Spirochaetales bacterium]HRY53867.1 ABC transporter ATP-binding protein [Spirochaetia bacterium]
MGEGGGGLLEIAELEVSYGGIKALSGVSLRVGAGEIVAVIGANGAGKSTLLKTIAGAKAADSGSMRFEGRPLPKSSHEVVRQGLTLVPEGRRIFPTLTVRENLLLGAYSCKDRSRVPASLERAHELFPVLAERASQAGGTLSGGEQQMLAVARALMSEPRLLLLDEPSLGLAPMVVDLVFDTIIRLNEETGLTILLVEQNAGMALDVCDRAYVLETGRIKLEGPGEELLADRRVQESYLGVGA